MLKQITIVLLLLFAAVSVLSAQTYEIRPYGISAAGVAADTNDIFDTKYNGSTNVGVGKVVYLAGVADDTTFTNPTWTIASKPAGSNVSFIAQADMDANTKIVKLIPDVEGTFQFELSDGGNVLAIITINAGLYKGLPDGFSCATCHGDVATSWSGTAHANAVQPHVDDPAGHFQEFCLGCHATGFDPSAVNDGFDDFDFVFPDSLQPGNYDALLASYPDAMQRANVQCEACHGPGSGHMSAGGSTADSKMISTLASENCAYCHDSFPHHVLPSQYDVSRHANPTTLARGSRAGCSDCHSGTGFIAWLKNGQATPSEIPDPERISCAVCHDPHNAENEGQLRLVSATLSNGYEVTAGDAGKLCMNCHKGRRDAVDYTDNYLDNLSSHFGPHYGTQGDMLAGQNAVTWGETLPSTLHINIVSNACVGCHMAEGEIDAEGNIPLSGGHSFGMRTPEGVANVEACSACHGNIGEDFNEITSNFEGSKDHDGDGVEEGLQEEVHGLLDLIIANIPNDGSGHPMVEDSTVTLVEAQAAFNYLMVYEDRSFGIHNPKFTVALLKLTLEKLGVSAVEKTDILPSVYSLEQNYPNPFNPTTIINFSIPESGNVKLAIYDALGREVDILIDKEMTAGNYNADWNASNFAAGIYFYSITVNDFTSTKKMVLLK